MDLSVHGNATTGVLHSFIPTIPLLFLRKQNQWSLWQSVNFNDSQQQRIWCNPGRDSNPHKDLQTRNILMILNIAQKASTFSVCTSTIHWMFVVFRVERRFIGGNSYQINARVTSQCLQRKTLRPCVRPEGPAAGLWV